MIHPFYTITNQMQGLSWHGVRVGSSCEGLKNQFAYRQAVEPQQSHVGAMPSKTTTTADYSLRRGLQRFLPYMVNKHLTEKHSHLIISIITFVSGIKNECYWLTVSVRLYEASAMQVPGMSCYYGNNEHSNKPVISALVDKSQYKSVRCVFFNHLSSLPGITVISTHFCE